VLLSNFDPDQTFETMEEDLRNYVNARDEGLCLLCGRLGSEPHHVKYRSLGGKNCANNLATLCNKCHYKIHNKKDEYKKLLLQRISENEKRLRDRLI
jgi:5-methylcytosine-specific restriction endonuclease McrA